MKNNPFLQTTRHTILLGLLLVHALWLLFHMYQHSQSHISPWRLGGYAMYVEPKVPTRISAYLEKGASDDILAQALYTGSFERKNWYFYWHCKPISDRSFISLIEDNPSLPGNDFMFVIHTEFFNKNTLRLQNQLIGTIAVNWIDDRTFSYTNDICDAAGEVKTITF